MVTMETGIGTVMAAAGSLLATVVPMRSIAVRVLEIVAVIYVIRACRKYLRGPEPQAHAEKEKTE